MKADKLSPQGVAEVERAMSAYVARGDFPGLVTLIARGDDVHVAAIGTLSVEGTAPMQRDTIFRIASVTKTLAGVAAMILIDDGKLRLEDSIEPWIPELANRRVLRRIDAALEDTVPATRAITVHDVLTFCLGFGSVMAAPNSYPIQKPIREGRLGGDGPEYLLSPPPMDVWLRRLGELPLMYQPGERWTYNTSADVLGVLIARVAGKSFEDFLHERVCGPLGMKDTAFSVPRTKLARLSSCYRFDPETKALVLFDGRDDSAWSRPPAFESAAGGLVSTADDLFVFHRIMLNKGRWSGTRIVSEASIEAMTRDQLTPWQREGAGLFFGEHGSWGLGTSVTIRQGEPWQVPGRFGWDGGFGTSVYADPKHDFIGILLTQRTMDSPDAPAAYEDFWSHAYRALRI